MTIEEQMNAIQTATDKAARRRKNVGGRTPLPSDVKRTEVVQTRATKAERECWDEMAYQRRTTLSELIRDFLNGEAGKQVTSSESPSPSSASPKPSPRKRAPKSGNSK